MLKHNFSMFSLKEKIEVQKYVSQKKELHNFLLKFIENENDSNDDFQNLIDCVQTQNILNDREELCHFLRLILKVYKNHHRQTDFCDKIGKILLNFINEIKQTLSNTEIFNIFKSSKGILLFLFDKKIITIDDSIVNLIMKKDDAFGQPYCHFFLTEIKEFVEEEKIKQIEKEISEIDSNFINNYNEKRKKGENDSLLCSLIRNDSLDEFVSYVNQENISLTSKVPSSIFETNSFLIDKEPSLIEYSAFFGSIKIFKYLNENNVELTSSLWLYAIHSNNFELIHLIEKNKVDPPDNLYEKCLEESIKCHHNNIANYIQNNEDLNLNCIEEVIDSSFRYYNYSFFPNDFSQNSGFYYLCRYNYTKLVDLSLKIKKKEIENEMKIFYLVLIEFSK